MKKKKTTETKTEPDRPITADELLAMDPDEVHEWVSRQLAERIAEGERRKWEERTGRKAESA